MSQRPGKGAGSGGGQQRGAFGSARLDCRLGALHRQYQSLCKQVGRFWSPDILAVVYGCVPAGARLCLRKAATSHASQAARTDETAVRMLG